MKKITQFGIMMFALIFSATSVFSQIVDDDFDSYNAGEQLVTQAWAGGSMEWTTWSDNPGSGEDPFVTTDQSVSGANSVVIETGNDLVLLLPEIITYGDIVCEVDVFVPTGCFGYFNVLTEFAGTASQWGTQMYFDAGGVGTIDAGGEGAGIFSYAYDTWINVVVHVDLDADLAQVIIDGATIIEWPWSLGTFGDPGPVQINALNFYAWDANGTPKFYLDNVSISHAVSSEVFEPFEEYALGGFVAEESLAAGNDWWTCWSGDTGAGTSEDAIVSDEQAFAGSQSMLVLPDNDMVFKLGDKVGGEYSISAELYIPTGNAGYFNAMHVWEPGGTGAEWAIEINYTIGGIGSATVDGGDQPFTFPNDEWFNVTILVDLTEDEAEFIVDGTTVHEWQWSLNTAGEPGVNALSALDFFGATADDYMFVDNIDFVIVTPPPGDPTIEVTPTEMTFEMLEGEVDSQVLTINNVGAGRLDFGIYWMYDLGKGGDAKDTYTLNYDGDAATNGIGSTATDATVYEVAAKFPISMYNAQVGMSITSVDYYLREAIAGDLTVRIYGHGTGIGPDADNIIYEEDFSTFNIDAWSTFDLTTPVQLLGGDVWVAIEITTIPNPDGTYPLGCDDGPWIDNALWLRSNGGGWAQPSTALPYNWHIRANCEGTPMVGWLDLDETSGQIWVEDQFETFVTADGSDLEMGTYTADIYIVSNDNVNPEVMVPVTLTIVSGIEEQSTISTLVYPNPTTGAVTIQSDVTIDRVIVYNYAGQEMANYTVGNTNYSINTDTYAKGVYIVRMETELGSTKTKLVVE